LTSPGEHRQQASTEGKQEKGAVTTLPSLEALLPEDVARKAESTGIAKAQRDALTLLTLAVLAGAFIALGAMFATLIATGLGDALPFGLARLLPALAFSLGLILVVVCGAELFTGDVLMTVAWAGGRLSLADMLRAWILVLIGNLAGGVGTAILVYLSGHWLLGEMQVGVGAVRIAAEKASLPVGLAFWRGVLCNVLVCLAVWGSLAARSVTDKVLIVVLPVAAFVAAGFEHSVANFYYLTLGWLLSVLGPSEFLIQLAEAGIAAGEIRASNILPTQAAVIAGNIAGGACLVALTYWLAYLRPRRAPAPAAEDQPERRNRPG
jgi:formate/nitrite transporter